MTGFGSPCGACKFLRRKCTRGCVFAPYFCHDEGATHFAAVHKVFGASNASKLLMHLPVSDRREAAVTIAYEAQARLQDPIYGCVSHIFALQKQVVNLQAQLATIKAQSAQNMINGLTSTSFPEEETKFLSKLNAYQQDLQGLCNNTSWNSSNMYCSNNGSLINWNSYLESSQICGSNNSLPQELLSFGYEANSSVDSLDMLMNTCYRDMEDLESVAYAYLHHS